MLNNDILRSVRYILAINDNKIVEILKLADQTVSRGELANWFKREDEEGFVRCPDSVMAHFLDGLVYFKRGKDLNRLAPPIELPVTNNLVLKKLRVAFELKEEDLHEILDSTGFPISKPELSALFRKAGHHNYRECGDQLLRNFLKGLAQRLRPAQPASQS